nr:hypothetical protein [uncultured Novosphingobium sp.]
MKDLKDTVFANAAQLPQIVLAEARYGAMSNNGTQGRLDLVRYWLGSLFFIIISTFGIVLLFNPISYLITNDPTIGVVNSAFWSPIKQSDGSLQKSSAIAGFSFLGGYVFSLRYLIRQTLNQELSALAFVRSGLRLIQGVFISMAFYHAWAAGVGGHDGLQTRSLALALLVAFAIGYFPDLGLARIAEIAKVYVKATDRDALENVKIIPLEMLDGIDHEIAFRLQESNLFDIQNLATANPLELYAETPYTLFQAFDWILQAQLCLVVGPQAFITLKLHRIRTIFDLERAVLAADVPNAYLRAIASILLIDSSLTFRSAIGLEVEYQADRRSLHVEATIIRHLVAVIADDLHVHRLRALWRAVTETTAGVTDDGRPLWLFNTGWLPGDPPLTPLEQIKRRFPRN